MAFYITALSNFDNDIFPENKPSDFKNRLVAEIPLPQAYEVALSEISYVTEFKSADHNAKLVIFDFLLTEDEGKTWGKLYEIEFDQSFITNATEIVSRLNTLIWINVPRLKRNPKREIFSWQPQDRRIWINFQPMDYVTICAQHELLSLLGVVKHESALSSVCMGRPKEEDEYKIIIYDEKLKKNIEVTRTFSKDYAKMKLPSSCETSDFFKNEPFLMSEVTQFIVYSQIIKESYFASTFANVLKIITVPYNTSGQRVAISYGSDRVYIPVATNALNQVSFPPLKWHCTFGLTLIDSSALDVTYNLLIIYFSATFSIENIFWRKSTS